MRNVKQRIFKTRAPDRETHPAELTLADLHSGECARIGCLECPQAGRCERLMAYGLVQGQIVQIMQDTPAFVIRVDQTELALDERVARCIHIQERV